MKPEQINAKIAELRGWIGIEQTGNAKFPLIGWKPDDTGIGGHWSDHPVPNYYGSLDACAEMRKWLNEGQMGRYYHDLCEVMAKDGDEYVWNATAPQYCLAFLRMFGVEVEIE